MTVAGPRSLLVAGIGEMVLSADADSQLMAYGLGSCIALAAWDPGTRIGGLAHFMLPSGLASQATPVKFIDSGLEAFLAALSAKGLAPGRSSFKAAGGAAMLTVGGGLAIGKRNATTIETALRARGIRLAAAALGGNAGRTVQLEVGSGRFLVKSLSGISQL